MRRVATRAHPYFFMQRSLPLFKTSRSSRGRALSRRLPDGQSRLGFPCAHIHERAYELPDRSNRHLTLGRYGSKALKNVDHSGLDFVRHTDTGCEGALDEELIFGKKDLCIARL